MSILSAIHSNNALMCSTTIHDLCRGTHEPHRGILGAHEPHRGVPELLNTLRVLL